MLRPYRARVRGRPSPISGKEYCPPWKGGQPRSGRGRSHVMSKSTFCAKPSILQGCPRQQTIRSGSLLLDAPVAFLISLPTLTLNHVSIYGVTTYGHNSTGTRVKTRQHRAVDFGAA